EGFEKGMTDVQGSPPVRENELAHAWLTLFRRVLEDLEQDLVTGAQKMKIELLGIAVPFQHILILRAFREKVGKNFQQFRQGELVRGVGRCGMKLGFA